MSEGPQGIGAGSSTSDWRESIQDESLRQNPTILNIKASNPNEAITALSEQLVHAQKVLGGEKVLRPQENWTPEAMREWKSEVLQIPVNAEGYKLEQFKAPEGIHLNEELKQNFINNLANPLELSDAQASSIFQHFVDSDQLRQKTEIEQRTQLAEQQLQSVKDRWGDNYDANMEIVEYGLKSTAPERLVKLISEDSVLSTDPDLIDTFYKVGQMLQSDNPAGLSENGQAPLGNKAAAMQRIQELEASEDWLKFINPKSVLTPTEQMQKTALLKERTDLYSVAYAE
jgi:hypothetical protein